MLIEKLNTLGVKLYKGVYPQNTALPYIVLTRATEIPVKSDDGAVLAKRTTWNVDLYTQYPDKGIESGIETIINCYEWSSNPDEYLSEENCYKVTYTVTINTKRGEEYNEQEI